MGRKDEREQKDLMGYRLRSYFKSNGSLNIRSDGDITLKGGALYTPRSLEWKEILRLLNQPNSWIGKYIMPVYQNREISVQG